MSISHPYRGFAACSQPDCAARATLALNADNSPICAPCAKGMETTINRIRKQMRDEGSWRYAASRLGAIDHGRVIRDMRNA